MPNFLTIEELSHNYVVTSERLLAYAARGNLSMSRGEGVLRFDEARVARLFPRRSESGASTPIRTRLGTLGHSRLGQPDTEE